MSDYEHKHNIYIVAEINSTVSRNIQIWKNPDKTLHIANFTPEHIFPFIMLIITFSKPISLWIAKNI